MLNEHYLFFFFSHNLRLTLLFERSSDFNYKYHCIQLVGRGESSDENSNQTSHHIFISFAKLAAVRCGILISRDSEVGSCFYLKGLRAWKINFVKHRTRARGYVGVSSLRDCCQPESWGYSPKLYSRTILVWSLIFRSTAHLEWIFVYGMRKGMYNNYWLSDKAGEDNQDRLILQQTLLDPSGTLMTLILQNYWGSTAPYPPSFWLPVSTLFPVLQASFLYKQTHLVRERDCLLGKRLSFRREREGKERPSFRRMVAASLWNAGVQVKNRSGMSRHPSFLICLYKPGGEGGWEVDWGSRDCLGTSVRTWQLDKFHRPTSHLIGMGTQGEKGNTKRKLRSKRAWGPLDDFTWGFTCSRA